MRTRTRGEGYKLQSGARGACGACKSACTEIRKAATFQRVRVLPNCRCEREAKMLMVMIIGNTIGEVISRSSWRELLSPFGVVIICLRTKLGRS